MRQKTPLTAKKVISEIKNSLKKRQENLDESDEFVNFSHMITFSDETITEETQAEVEAALSNSIFKDKPTAFSFHLDSVGYHLMGSGRDFISLEIA